MRRRITIRGIVQGVGFRPFVYRLAHRFGIGGEVYNTTQGVVIDAEGDEVERFIEALRAAPPPHARLDAVDIEELPPLGHTAFSIRESIENGGNGGIVPDLALCRACAAEMDDPSNRRYRYPFITCTECGPRYTILQIPPYDRVRTSMKHFTMCTHCESEYRDPASRRYHAEAICCPQCGPGLSLRDARGSAMEGDAIERTAALIREGRIAAVKGIGGFHLVCDATSEDAVARLRQIKRRPAKPLAVMFSDLQEIERHARIGETEGALVSGAAGPIVLLEVHSMAPLASTIAPGIAQIGAMLPYAPLYRLLLDAVERPIVITSANLGDEPLCTRAEEVVHQLGEGIDVILDHNRPIVNALDDSVVQVAAGEVSVIRMGRGYAPFSLPLNPPVPTPLLALGAHQKNAIAVAAGENLLLGGHIGDMEGIAVQERFERTIRTMERFAHAETQVIGSDLHPLYATSRYAQSQGKRHFSVQHHYAHVLSAMAEYGLREKVLGFAFDGNGYGEDATVWGGEVMVADVHRYERLFSLKPFVLIGNERAIREPRRVALALLFERYSLDEVLSLSSPTVEAFMDHEIRQLHHIWTKRIASPISSSMGRLFDAIASLGGWVQRLEYEAQSGLVIEGSAREGEHAPFAFALGEGIIDPLPMIEEIVALYRDAPDPEAARRVIAGRFIATVVEMMARIAESHPDLPVVVGGGVFQNRILMERLQRRFSHRRFCAQRRTPPGDGGIALGQAWWGVHNG